MSRKLKVGIAGYGVVGRRRREFIDQHPAFCTIAVCDRALDERADLLGGVRPYTHYEKMLASEQFDALFVCLPNDLAAQVTIAGLEKGLHVFCEKPPGRDLKDICDVIACERRHPRQRLKYGFNHRYHDSVRDALAVVRTQRLGEVINLRGVYGKSAIINFESDWRTKRAIAGGGILLDQGIHMVDLLRLFAGDFESVHAVVSNGHWKHNVEDNVYATLRTASGVVAMLHSSATQWRHRFNLEIALTKGSLILSGILSGSKSYGAETLTVVTASEHDRGDPREETVRYNQDNSWRDEIADFAEAVLADRPVIDGSSAEALKTMHLLYRIYCADTAWRTQWGLSDELPAAFR
jgi:predicted dehydrogenase